METSSKTSVSINDFETIRLLGKGEYGKVLLVRKKDSGELFALKIMKKKLIQDKNQIEHTKSERSVLERSYHPYIVRLRYAFRTKLKLYLALEYCPGGELYYHINNFKKFSEPRAKFYSACIVLALDYLHSQNIIYRDLKPENIVIDQEGYPKITDFGLAKENISIRDLTKTVCGTPEYIAPEIILRQGYSHSVDWWSLGCIIYEMLIGLPPFYVEERKEIYRNIIQKPVKFNSPINPIAVDLIINLLVKDPKRRLGAKGGKEIMNHMWFSDIDWEKLYRKEIRPCFVPNIDDPSEPNFFCEENYRESPNDINNFDGSHGYSPTYIGFSYSAGSENCRLNIECDDI